MEIYQGYRRIFWGFFFLTFYIELLGIRILPAFIAVLIIISGVSKIRHHFDTKNWRSTFLLSGVLLVLSIADSLLKITEVSEIYHTQSFSLAYQSITILFYLLFAYYMLAGSIEWFRNSGFEESAKTFENKLFYYTLWYSIAGILQLAAVVVMNITLMVVAILFSFAVRIWLLRIIYLLSKTVKNHMQPITIPTFPDLT